jgi:hypothetical protein
MHDTVFTNFLQSSLLLSFFDQEGAPPPRQLLCPTICTAGSHPCLYALQSAPCNALHMLMSRALPGQSPDTIIVPLHSTVSYMPLPRHAPGHDP